MLLLKINEFIFSSPAKRDKIILANLAVSLLLNLALWLAAVYKFWNAKEYIILHYNIYFGISSLGPWYLILLIPVLGLLVLLVNLPLIFYFYLKRQILSYFLSLTITVFNLIMLTGGLLLIYIN